MKYVVIGESAGASRDDIMADYMLSDAAGVGAYPGSLSAVLDEIESVGGIETYLSSVGVSAKTMQAIRRQLTTFA